jgi:hypothetical protein
VPLFVRKIDKAKWLQTDIIGGADVSADAITNCIRTKNNTLSVWEISTEDEVDEAALAVVSSGQHLETFDVVLMNAEHLHANGLEAIPQRESALTPVEDLKDAHRDLAMLTYSKLGIIARHIVDRFRQEKIIRFTEGTLKSLLSDAIKNGRIRPDDLDENIQRKLHIHVNH